jgi:hypothetical protein
MRDSIREPVRFILSEVDAEECTELIQALVDRRAVLVRSEWIVGDRVSFEHKGNKWYGVIHKMNAKTFGVKVKYGEVIATGNTFRRPVTYRVYPGFLSRVPESIFEQLERETTR